MKLTIQTLNDTVGCYKDFKDVSGRGEIAHFITELEIIKSELLMMWLEWKDEFEIKR